MAIRDLQSAEKFHREQIATLLASVGKLETDNVQLRDRLARLEEFRASSERNTFTFPAAVTMFVTIVVALISVAVSAIFGVLNYLKHSS